MRKGSKRTSESIIKQLATMRRNGWCSRERCNNWKGGRFVNTQGYVLILKPDHPFATKQGYVVEHRLVMEQHLGRYLEPLEVVHHIDGNKQNNILSNLQLMTKYQHDSMEGSKRIKRYWQRRREAMMVNQ